MEMTKELLIKRAKNRKFFAKLKAGIISASSTVLLGVVLGTVMAFAEGEGGGGAGAGGLSAATGDETQTVNAWNQIIGLICTWVPRIGAVVIGIGGIEFAFAFKSEDVEGKTKALRTVAAGAIAGAVAFAMKAFMSIEK